MDIYNKRKRFTILEVLLLARLTNFGFEQSLQIKELSSEFEELSLILNVISASGIQGITEKKSNPFFKVLWEESIIYESKVIYKTCYPGWNESMPLKVNELIKLNLPLKIRFYSKSMNDNLDSYLGEASIIITDVIDRMSDGDYEGIYGIIRNDETNGQISLKIRLSSELLSRLKTHKTFVERTLVQSQTVKINEKNVTSEELWQTINKNFVKI